MISIHAPRMGCDISRDKCVLRRLHFNPRTPYGVRQVCAEVVIGNFAFQSTHPVWGATRARGYVAGERRISIHAPRMGCDLAYLCITLQRFDISIHAPRMGCDLSLF